VFLGYDAGETDYCFGIGDDTSYLQWDGSAGALDIKMASGEALTIEAGGDIILNGSDADQSLLRFIDPPTDDTYSSEIRFERYGAPTEYWYVKKIPEDHATQNDWFIIAPTDELIAAAGADTKIIIGKHPFESNRAYSFEINVSDYIGLSVKGSLNWAAEDGKSYFYGNVGVGIIAPVAKLHVDQSAADGAKPVITVDQADISEEFIKFIGSAASGVLTQSIVDEGDQGSATLAGWLKIYVEDVGNQVTDGVYHVPFYTLAA